MLIESFCFAGGRVHKYQIESPKQGDQKHRPRIFSHCLDDVPITYSTSTYQTQVMKFHFPHRWDQR